MVPPQCNEGASGAPVLRSGSLTFDAASCGADAVTLQSVTIAGVVPGDIVLFRPRTATANLAWAPGSCTVAGTAIVPAINPTAGAIDPASGTYDYTLIRCLPAS
jgi:hypothetical protein